MSVAATSIDALRAIAPDVGARYTAILAAFHAHLTGLTSDDVAAELRLPLDSVRPRIVELMSLGVLRWTDERRITRAGRARKRAGKSPTRARVMVLASRMEGRT